MAKYEKVGGGTYGVYKKKESGCLPILGGVFVMILLIGFLSQCSAASAESLSFKKGSSKAEQRIYAELRKEVMDYIKAQPIFLYDEDKFTMAAYEAYDFASVSTQFGSGSVESLSPERQKEVKLLKQEIQIAATNKYGLAASRGIFVLHLTMGKISAEEAFEKEKQILVKKHGRNLTEVEFKKESLLEQYYRKFDQIVQEARSDTAWDSDTYLAAKIQKAKKEGFAKAHSGELVKRSELLSEFRLRAYTDREGLDLAHDTFLTKLFGHEPEVYQQYFSDRLCDLIYEYIDKGLTPSGLIALRTRIISEWNSAKGDLTKLKKTGTAFSSEPQQTTQNVEQFQPVASGQVHVAPAPPTTIVDRTPASPSEQLEEATDDLIDGAAEQLKKIKIPKFKW
ncbi:MAG: hypothetical protein CML13_10355 [Puniceicoccaceae bacterium]|nr:hypothetical protein [Puniceicoccaceae bacterium]|tara:strand:- start:153 stop:1337 length:1185 start_codon:yes stop_codon:yes gene_type:complete